MSVLNDRYYWPMYRVKWARSVNEVQQGQEDSKASEEKMENLAILVVVVNVDEKAVLVHKEERGPWD